MYNKAEHSGGRMAATFRILGIIAIIILALFIASIFKLPWPVNIIIGGLILFSFIVVVTYDLLSRRTEKNTGQTDE